MSFLIHNGIILPFGFFFVLAVIRAMGTRYGDEP